MSGKALRFAAAGLLLSFALHDTAMATIAVTVDTPSLSPGGTVFSTQGWSFTPAANITVMQLGVFDLGGDGLGAAHAVGIWTAGGTLLVSATVPAGTAATLIGGTRFVDVPATVLSAGQSYVIGAYYLNGMDSLLFDGQSGNVFDHDAYVTPEISRFGLNQFSGLAFPGTTVPGSMVRLGPNFAFTVPATRTWPTDPAPCNDINDLAACINGANSAEVIEIAANAIPGQTVNVVPPKSFSLRPATDFSPVFGGETNFYVSGGTASVSVVMEGLTLDQGAVLTGDGSGLLDLTIRNNFFQHVTSSPGAIEMFFRTGPTVLRIDNNSIGMDAALGGDRAAITVSRLNGTSNSVRIRGNHITQTGGGGVDGVIKIANGIGTLNLDITGNQISGSDFKGGIGILQGDLSGTGHVSCRIVNNVISGQVNGGNAPAAISLRVSFGSADFKVINNTVAFNETGIQLTGQPGQGATATAVISNNIVAFNTGAGMSLQDFPATTINDFNLVWLNGSNVYAPGPGTLSVDPLFSAPNFLRPQGGSQAEDSGSNTRMPVDIRLDVAGNARILGIIDRGAYEGGGGGSDLDHDGIADGFDNCTLIYNPNQRDTDGDNYGNLCDGDFDHNNIVGFPDLAIFRSRFGTTNADADLDGSGGVVNFADLAIFRSLFGKPPGPSGTALQ